MKSVGALLLGIAAIAVLSLIYFGGSKNSDLSQQNQSSNLADKFHSAESKKTAAVEDFEVRDQNSPQASAQISTQSSLQNPANEKKSSMSAPALNRKPARKRFQPSSDELASSQLFEGTRWRIWKGVAVVPNVKMAEGTVPDVGSYNVVESPTTHADLQNFKLTQPVVVFNERQKQVGIVTGVFNVELEKNSRLSEVLQRHNLVVTSSFPAIHRYFLTSKDSTFNLERLKNELEESPLVSHVELEILSGVHEKF